MKYKYLMIAAALAVSCTAELDTGTDAVREASLALSRKVVNTKSRQTADDEFLLKFDKVPGVELLDSICAMGAVSVEPVFLPMPGKETLRAKFGLDRWYSVKLDNAESLEKIVRECAVLSAVGTIEYSQMYRKASDEVSHPYYPSNSISLAAASDKIFNDPSLGD